MKRGVARDARIIDDNIHRAKLAFDLLEAFLRALKASDVELVAFDAELFLALAGCVHIASKICCDCEAVCF